MPNVEIIFRTLVRPQVAAAHNTAVPPPSAPPPVPTSTYYPTKAFVKAGTDGVATGQEYDAANSVMKLHQLAIHNQLADVYEKVSIK